MEVVYLTDITGTIGAWLSSDFVDDVPSELVIQLQRAYDLAVAAMDDADKSYE